MQCYPSLHSPTNIVLIRTFLVKFAVDGFVVIRCPLYTGSYDEFLVLLSNVLLILRISFDVNEEKFLKIDTSSKVLSSD